MATFLAPGDVGFFEVDAALSDDAFGSEVRACLDAIADFRAVAHEERVHGGRLCDCPARPARAAVAS